MRTAVRPDKIAAGESFHGGGLYTDATASPHHVLLRIKARLYFGHAVNDQSVPAEAIKKLDRARWPHGATNTTAKPMTAPITDGRLRACPSTKTKQAARAFDQLTELFTQTLK
jgi:carboxymethylenebutenolidase